MSRLLLGILCLLVFASSAKATTLVVDPVHPFTAQEMTQMQRWIDVAGGRVRTAPGSYIISKGYCPELKTPASCALNHQIWLAFSTTLDRFTLLHEMGHEDQMFDGPGSIEGALGGYPANVGWSAAKIARIGWMLDMPNIPFWATPTYSSERIVAEVSADGYGICAMHKTKPRVLDSYYRFKVGATIYHQFCEILKGA